MRPEDSALIDSWQLSLHDKSRGTVKLYTGVLHQFADWLETGGRPALHDLEP